jgi:hypothetical protein
MRVIILPGSDDFVPGAHYATVLDFEERRNGSPGYVVEISATGREVWIAREYLKLDQ